jgi:hypothetical protein
MGPLGKRAEALEMFREKLEASRRVRGEGRPNTQDSLSNYESKRAQMK